MSDFGTARRLTLKSTTAVSAAMDTDVSGKRSAMDYAADREAKRMNDAIHSPMKVKPSVEEEVTVSFSPAEKAIMAAVTNLSREVETKVATKQDVHAQEVKITANVKELISQAIDR